MQDRLPHLTTELVAELETVFCRGRETPGLRHALCAYVTYWRRMGATADRVVQHTERLIARIRDDVPELAEGADEEVDALAAEIIDRCVHLASVEDD